jgi:hypothetical protein
MPSMDDTPGARYMEAAAAEDGKLDERLTMIRREEDEGSITVREAAAERVKALEGHLAATRALRLQHFGSDCGPARP